MQEASVMTSLHELRSIEQQRIADEHAARERARQAQEHARRAAEQAREAEAAARERAERDERLRIEEARAAAEREVRMRVEAHEAAERARFAAQLEQQRLAHEVELRRADIAKRRPRWMVAVTAVALAGAVGFGALAVDRMHDADTSMQAKAHADAETAAAKQQAAAAVGKLEAMQKTLDELDAKVRDAQHAVATATTKLDLEQAQARLAEANRKAAKARADAAELQRIKDKQARDHVIDVSKCAGQVLCH